MTITLNKKYTRDYQTEAMKELIKEVKSLYTVGDFLDMVNKAHGNKYHGEIIKTKFEAFASNDYTSEWLSIQAEFYILDCLEFHYVRTYFHYTEDDGLNITEDPVLFNDDMYCWKTRKNEAPEEPTEEEKEEEKEEESIKVLPEKLYKDTESGEVKTEDELTHEFGELVENNPDEYEGVTFWQYLKNCQTYNGGTLEKHGEYISYRIYTTPTNPTERGKYVTRCPIYKQAFGFCERGASRGKSYFIKGVTLSGEEIMIL